MTHVTLEESKRNRRRTDNRLLHSASHFNLTQRDNDDMLTDLSLRLDDMVESIPDLNEKVRM